MREIVNTVVNMQINLLTSGPTAAVSFVVLFDVLLVYTASFLFRKKASQVEASFVLLAAIIVTLTVLEFTR